MLDHDGFCIGGSKTFVLADNVDNMIDDNVLCGYFVRESQTTKLAKTKFSSREEKI